MGAHDGQHIERKDKRRGSYQPTTSQPPQSVFINLELGKEQQAEYRAWRDDTEAVFIEWGEILDNGYRINTKYDDYSSSYAAFIIPDQGSDNAGYILTGRGGNPYRAVSEAIYKHVRLLHGEWAGYDAGRKPVDDPDY